MKLGKIVKNAGHAQRNVFGADLISIRWAKGAMGVVDNLTKNFFAIMSYQWPRALLSCFALLFLNLMPFAGIFLAHGWARLAYAIAPVFNVFHLRGNVDQVGYSALLLFAASGEHSIVCLHHAAFDVSDSVAWGVQWRRHVLSVGRAAKRHGLERGRRSERPSEERSYCRGMRRFVGIRGCRRARWSKARGTVRGPPGRRSNAQRRAHCDSPQGSFGCATCHDSSSRGRFLLQCRRVQRHEPRCAHGETIGRRWRRLWDSRSGMEESIFRGRDNWSTSRAH